MSAPALWLRLCALAPAVLLLLWLAPWASAQAPPGPYPRLAPGPLQVRVSSEELPTWAGVNTQDGNAATIWHSLFHYGLAPKPHFVSLDLGAPHWVDGVLYQGRPGTSTNGRLREFRVEGSADGEAWQAVSSGSFANDALPQQHRFAPVRTRHVRLVWVSQHVDTYYGSAADVGVYGQAALATCNLIWEQAGTVERFSVWRSLDAGAEGSYALLATVPGAVRCLSVSATTAPVCYQVSNHTDGGESRRSEPLCLRAAPRPEAVEFLAVPREVPPP